MRNKVILTAVILFALNGPLPSFAASNSKDIHGGYIVTITGQVTSINSANSTFVIKDQDDDKEYVVAAWESDLATLNQGDVVSVVMRQGSNRVISIKH